MSVHTNRSAGGTRNSDKPNARLTVDEATKDFTVVVEGRKLRTSRKRLETQSEYFRALFSSGMRESVTKSVKLQNVDLDTMRRVIEYCETSRLIITEDCAQRLLAASDMLQIDELRDRVESYYQNRLTLETAPYFFTIADVYNSRKLREKCAKLICWCLDKVVANLTSENYDVVKYILSCEYVHVDENLICQTIFAVTAGRSAQEITDLMELLYMGNVSLRTRSLDLYRLVAGREGNRKDSCTIGVVSEDRVLYRWDRRCNEMRRYTTLPVKNCGFNLVKLRNYLYLIGGETRIGYGGWNNTVYRFDALRNTWDEFTSMKECRRSFYTVVAGDRIYLFNGHGKYRVSMGSNVAVLDLQQRCWNQTLYIFRQASGLPTETLVFHKTHFYHVISTHTVYKFDESQLGTLEGEAVSIPSVKPVSVLRAFSICDYILCLTSKLQAILWNPDTNVAFDVKISNTTEFIHCRMVDMSLYNVVDNELHEYMLDINKRTLNLIGEYTLVDGNEPICHAALCVVPYF